MWKEAVEVYEFTFLKFALTSLGKDNYRYGNGLFFETNNSPSNTGQVICVFKVEKSCKLKSTIFFTKYN
jgi:hypothetical protein